MKTKPIQISGCAVSQLDAGAAGSGRFLTETGDVTADEASANAQLCTRYAARDQTPIAHESAGDAHFTAGRAMSRAGHAKRATEHFEQAASHYKTAQLLSECDAKNAKDGEPSFSDKGAFQIERERNLSEGGGAAGGDYLRQKPSGEKIQCPNCQKSFSLFDSIGGNGAETVCPYCAQPIVAE